MGKRTIGIFMVLCAFVICVFVFGNKENKALPEPDYNPAWSYNNQIVHGNLIDAALEQIKDGLFMLRDSSCNNEDTYIKILRYGNDNGVTLYKTMSRSEFDSTLSESSCLYLNEGVGVLDILSPEENEDTSEELVGISPTKRYVAKCIRESSGMVVGMYFEELKKDAERIDQSADVR